MNIFLLYCSLAYLDLFSCLIGHATLWAWFKCYQITSQPVNQAICILLFSQLYLVIFVEDNYYYIIMIIIITIIIIIIISCAHCRAAPTVILL